MEVWGAHHNNKDIGFIMTKYVALLRKAIDNRKNPGAAYRRHIYIRARLAIDMKLLEIGATEPVVKQHRAMLEAAIMEIETYYISETIMNELKKSGAIAPLDKSFADGEDELDIEDNYNQLGNNDDKHFNIDDVSATADTVRKRIRDQVEELPKPAVAVAETVATIEQSDSYVGDAATKNDTHISPVETQPSSSITETHKGQSGSDNANVSDKNVNVSAEAQHHVSNVQSSSAYTFGTGILKGHVQEATQSTTFKQPENTSFRDESKQKFDTFDYRNSGQQSELKAERSSDGDLHSRNTATYERDIQKDVDTRQTNERPEKQVHGGEYTQPPQVQEINIDNNSAIPNFSAFLNFNQPPKHQSPYNNHQDREVLEEKKNEESSEPQVTLVDDEDVQPETNDHWEENDGSLKSEVETRGRDEVIKEDAFDEDAVPDFLRADNQPTDMQSSYKEEDDVDGVIEEKAQYVEDTYPAYEKTLNHQDAYEVDPKDDYNLGDVNKDPNASVAWSNINNPVFASDDNSVAFGNNRRKENNPGIQAIAYVVNISLVLFFCIVVFVVYRNYYANKSPDIVKAENTATVKKSVGNKTTSIDELTKNLASVDYTRKNATETQPENKATDVDTHEISTASVKNDSVQPDNNFQNEVKAPEQQIATEVTTNADDANLVQPSDNEVDQKTAPNNATQQSNTKTSSETKETTDQSDIASLSTAMLYDQKPDKKWNKVSSSRVDWTILPTSTGNNGNHQYAAKADILFAAQSLVAGVTIKKNTDKNLAASYILEIRFKYTGTEKNKTISDIDHIDLEVKNNNATQNFIISKFDDNYFASALIVDEKNKQLDDELMRAFQGINIIFSRSDNEKFFIYLDKGKAGEEAISKVIAG